MYQGNDRVRQVNEIQSIASDLTSADWEWNSAKELAQYWLSEVEDLPTWWDNHDTQVLVNFIERFSIFLSLYHLRLKSV